MSFPNVIFPFPKELEYGYLREKIPNHTLKFFRKAEKKIKKGQVENALDYYQDAIENNEFFYSQWGSAYCYMEMDLNKQAKEYFEKAYSVCDTVGSFLNHYAEFTAFQLQDSRMAVYLAAEAFRIDQNDQHLMLLIDTAKKLGCNSRVENQFKLLINDFPEMVNLYIYFASFLSNIGKQAEAVEYGRKALILAKDPFYLKLIVYILTNNGYFVEAAQICETLTNSFKKSVHTDEAWAYLEYKQGHYKNSEFYYKKALKGNINIQNFLNLARINHFFHNNPKKAIYYCKSALQVDRKNTDAYYLLAEIYRKKKDLKTALKFSEKQLELLPSHSQSWYYHGKLLYEQKNFSQAVKFFEKAVVLNPEIMRYRYILSKAYARAGMKEKAIKTYKNYLNEPLEDLWKEEKMLIEKPPIPKK